MPNSTNPIVELSLKNFKYAHYFVQIGNFTKVNTEFGQRLRKAVVRNPSFNFVLI